MARAKKSVSAPVGDETVRESFPENWADVRGHGEIISRLRALAVTRRLPHALLFCGTEGVGKRRTARVLARTLLCAAGGDAPCGQCDSCRTMATGVHPDYFEVAPEARGKSAAMIRTDAVRDILIDGADRMNEAAANRLLKTLEEPTGAVLFILVTNAYDAILPTIRSRAVRIAFGALPTAEIAAALAARGSEHAAAIAALADGSLGRAYALAEEGLALRDDALDLLSQLPNLSVEDIWARAEELGARPHAERTAWISYVQMALRDLLLLREDGGSNALCHIDQRETLTALLACMADSDIFALMDGARELTRRFAANVNPALQAEAFLLRARKQFI